MTPKQPLAPQGDEATPHSEATLDLAVFEAAPSRSLVLDPADYRIVAVSTDYLALTRRTRGELVGKVIFDAFPDDPANPEDCGTANLLASFELVRHTLRPDAMPVQRHPILNPDTGKLEERFWKPLNLPVLDAGGKLKWLIHSTEDATSLMQSEETLRRARTLERIAGKAARVGGWMLELDNNRNVTWAREIFDMCEWEGVAPPAASAFFGLMKPADREHLMRAVQEGELHAKPFDLEVEMTSFKGKPLWMRIVSEPETDALGKVVRLIGAGQDITRQKTEQLHNQQLSSQLFSTLENMSDAFFLLDARYEIQYMNAEAERLLEIDSNNIVGRNYFEAFPECQGSVVEAGILNAAKHGDTWRGEYFRGAQQQWLSISIFPTRDSLAIYFRSTTDEKHMQRRIAESQERLQYVTEATLDVVWDVDFVNGTCWCNSGVGKFGYDFGNQVIGREDWVSKMHPDDMNANLPALDRTLADPSAHRWSCSYRFLTAAGKWVRFEDRSYILRDENGKPVRMIGGSTDVTKRLEMEEQLLQTQRLESLGQLTGGIAHDFNNLLTVILGNAELLQDDLQQHARLLRLANHIDMAATRGANLTRQLLAFSRKQTLQPVAVDINKLLVNLRGMLSRTLGEHIVINVKSQYALWSAYVDPNQLEVALLNLCINSRDAMPDGGTLTMETCNVTLDEAFPDTHLEVKPGDYVRISITDTGVGIPADVLDRVFEPFFTTKEKGKGTGLGLSMVFGFVKQSNGHISVYSEVGLGTTIHLYLPCSGDEVAATAENTRQVVEGGNEIVLMVEDNDLVRQFGQELLRSLGYQVLTASDGASALEMLRDQNEIQLLFTDVVMPGMGGPDLARRALALRPGLKVLYASGYTQDSMMHNGKLDAGVHLLAKPYGKAELARKLREALEAGNT